MLQLNTWIAACFCWMESVQLGHPKHHAELGGCWFRGIDWFPVPPLATRRNVSDQEWQFRDNQKTLFVEGIYGIIPPSLIGIILNHCKDPY